MAGSDVMQTSDVVYGTAGGVPLRLDYAVPDARTAAEAGFLGSRGLPVAMYIHGGAWLFGDRAGEAERQRMLNLARHGFFSVSVGYRLATTAVFPAQIQDIWSAVRWLRRSGSELGADATRLAVWGHSAGGHLAALVGLTAGVSELGGDGLPVKAVVPVSAPTNLYTMGGTHDDVDSPESQLVGAHVRKNRALADRASPVTYAPAAAAGGAPPFLIVHGEADTVVPFEQAVELHEALPTSTMLAVGGGDHDFNGGTMGWNEIARAALAFFQRHLA